MDPIPVLPYSKLAPLRGTRSHTQHDWLKAGTHTGDRGSQHLLHTEAQLPLHTKATTPDLKLMEKAKTNTPEKFSKYFNNLHGLVSNCQKA